MLLQSFQDKWTALVWKKGWRSKSYHFYTDWENYPSEPQTSHNIFIYLFLYFSFSFFYLFYCYYYYILFSACTTYEVFKRDFAPQMSDFGKTDPNEMAPFGAAFLLTKSFLLNLYFVSDFGNNSSQFTCFTKLTM